MFNNARNFTGILKGMINAETMESMFHVKLFNQDITAIENVVNMKYMFENAKIKD